MIDLQCCQTRAQTRGIGRFSLAFAKAIVQVGAEHDFIFLLNGGLLPASSELIAELEALRSQGRIINFDHPRLGDGNDRALRELVANLLRNDRVETLRPDVYHVSSLFEGDSIFEEAAPYTALPSGTVTSATMYDLIPSLYPEHYLAGDVMNRWYNRTLAVAKTFDVLLAISDATKQHAIDLLQVDPGKIVNVSGSVDSLFRKLRPFEPYVSKFWGRIEPRQRFVLYVGGPDHRKNFRGAVEGFANAADTLDAGIILVLVLDLDPSGKAGLLELTTRLGIEDRVVVTGQIADADLLELYNRCSLFLFPSLYEGLGLPVIEAMRCGAPVLVGDNSSLIEIVPEARYRFDAADPRAIGAAVVRAFNDPGELDRMRAYAQRRGQDFTWERSAGVALQAWEARHAERSSPPPLARAPKIAMFTPLPTEQTGIADYSADFAPALSRHAALTLFNDDTRSLDCDLGVPIVHHSRFDEQAHDFDVVVYQLGNSPYHHYMLPYMERHAGIVVLHDAYLGHLRHDPSNPQPFIRNIIEEEGPAARAAASEMLDLGASARLLIERFSCGGGLVNGSHGAIVHSQVARQTLLAACDLATGAQIAVVPQFRAGIATQKRTSKEAARRALALPLEAMVVATFGHVASTKGILELVGAYDRVAAAAPGPMRLVLVGLLEGGPEAATPYAQEVLAAIKGRDDIEITGFVDQHVYDLYLSAIDIGVQLRTVTRGETSGAMLNLLMNGVPFVYNRFGAAAELPTHVACGIDACTVETVAEALGRLVSDAGLRQRYQRASLDFARDVLDEDRLADLFVRAAVAMTDSARACGPQALSRKLGRVLATAKIDDAFLAEISAAYVAQERSELPPRLLIVVSACEGVADGLETTRALLRATYRAPSRVHPPQSVAVQAGQLVRADGHALDCGAALARVDVVRNDRIELRFYEKMLFADNGLLHGDAIGATLATLERRGGAAFAIVDDSLAITAPELLPSRTADRVAQSLALLLRHGAGLICPSEDVAESVTAFAARPGIVVRPGFRLGIVAKPRLPDSRLEAGSCSHPTPDLAQMGSVFVLAGTIGTANRQRVAIDAMESVWAREQDAALLLLVPPGWNLHAEVASITSHARFGRKLFLVEQPSAPQAAELYALARAALVFAAGDQGRALVEEAVAHGAPLLLDETPSLRQLGGEHARYCDAATAAGVASALLDLLEDGDIPQSAPLSQPSLEDYVRDILAFVHGNAAHHRF